MCMCICVREDNAAAVAVATPPCVYDVEDFKHHQQQEVAGEGKGAGPQDLQVGKQAHAPTSGHLLTTCFCCRQGH